MGFIKKCIPFSEKGAWSAAGTGQGGKELTFVRINGRGAVFFVIFMKKRLDKNSLMV